uniref:HAT C-terminal dimerisation domain-containing protein n=1 Tax=Sander lucioperca TaxID=283035 RepID=A0A8C9X343_SANLU
SKDSFWNLKRENSFKSFFTARKGPTITMERKRELDVAFFKIIYMDYEPLSKGEREGMQDFASAAQPGYTLPCYNTVRDTLMPHALEEMEAILRDLLQNGDGLVLSADIWTSRRGHSFLGIVASFIDGTFRGHTVLLGCEHIQGHHTADRIYQKYESVLKYWNVQRRVIRVVTDSGSNMIKAFNLLPGTEEEAEGEVTADASSSAEHEEEDEEPPAPSQVHVEVITTNVETMINQYFTVSNLHLRCPIHMLQLAIKDAVKEHDNINRLLVKVGKLVKSVHKSTLNTEETDQLGVRPANACATRWSSQLRVIQSVIRLFQKDPLWQNKLKSNVANITLNQVCQLTHLVSVLTPLADLTEKMQKELGNLGMILPAVTEIKSLLTDDTHAALPMGIAAFAETLANNVSTRYGIYYTDKHLILASVLDPRFKTEWIIRDESVCNKLGEIRDLLIKEAEEMNNPDADVIRFWKENSTSFPRLSKVARIVFSIPSGSASAKRVFSAAGLISRNHHMSLKPQTLSKLVFFKVNSKEL